MTKNLILAIDQGTTSSRAMLIDSTGRVVGSGTCGVSIGSPRPGWIEQDAGELWASVLTSITTAVAACPGASILGIAVSNQRESVVAWRAGDGRPVGPAISWQDQRGEAVCRDLGTPDNRELVSLLSGLELGSMFSASKIAWFLERYQASADLRIGTVDAWLVDRLTGGAVYATEAGNASRTLLFDINTQDWSKALGELFGVDIARLPEVRPSVGPWGSTWQVRGIPDGTPILAVLGDSHAALYGHWALAPEHRGVGKATYGTGSSVMIPTDQPGQRIDGVATTLAWQAPKPVWAFEGNILYSGAGMDWLARSIGSSPGRDFSALAATAESSRGAVFVPALNGLGAPWWVPSAVGTLTGLTSATTRADIARAGIESVAHQICDVVDAMDAGGIQPAIHAGGGATGSEILMQTQADLLGRDLLVSGMTEISALGVAALGFTAAGVDFAPNEDIAPRVVHPSPTFTLDARAESRAAWSDALTRAGVARATTTSTTVRQQPRRS